MEALLASELAADRPTRKGPVASSSTGMNGQRTGLGGRTGTGSDLGGLDWDGQGPIGPRRTGQGRTGLGRTGSGGRAVLEIFKLLLLL